MRRFFVVVLLITPFVLMARAAPSKGKALRTGSFYYCSQVDDNHLIFIRGGEVQKEVNRETGDAAFGRFPGRATAGTC